MYICIQHVYMKYYCLCIYSNFYTQFVKATSMSLYIALTQQLYAIFFKMRALRTHSNISDNTIFSTSLGLRRFTLFPSSILSLFFRFTCLPLLRSRNRRPLCHSFDPIQLISPSHILRPISLATAILLFLLGDLRRFVSSSTQWMRPTVFLFELHVTAQVPHSGPISRSSAPTLLAPLTLTYDALATHCTPYQLRSHCFRPSARLSQFITRLLAILFL